MKTSWSFGDVFNATSRSVSGDQPAIICDDQITNWATLSGRAGAVAATLQWHEITPGAKVAHYLRNGPAYLETSFACFLAGLVHVNVNFRYGEQELYYLFDNSDCEVIVYDREFAPLMMRLHPKLDKVHLFIEVNNIDEPQDFASSYESIASSELIPTHIARSSNDLMFIYTGGTTGLPKGVMWQHGDLWAVLGGGAPVARGAHLESLDELSRNVSLGLGYESSLICPPLMHGSGYTKAVYTLLMGGTVAIMSDASFNAENALRSIEKNRLMSTVVVGDAFGRPLLRALGSAQRKYDLSSLKVMTSGGAVLSQDVKDGLLRHIPWLTIVDAYGSSESIAIGINITRLGKKKPSAQFRHNALTKVLDDDGNEIEAGSNRIGKIARTGPLPVGYYKDPEKTQQTFITIKGNRYVFPGDFARVLEDGSIVLLGRGNTCINTGGEKVFAEEVEENLKLHSAVDDALVFPMPEEKWGQAVTAVVELAAPVEVHQLREHLKSRLAAYKVPKKFIFVRKVPRTPSGKPDYEAAKALAESTSDDVDISYNAVPLKAR